MTGLETRDSPPAVGSSDPFPPGPGVGAQLGPYRIIRLLGEGGMGRVYVAEHIVIARRVALKVLRRDQSSNERSVSRFFAEARVVNQIHHSGIVEVTDLFIDDGQPCIVMELLEGGTLADVIARDGHLSVRDALLVSRQVADALVAAHRHGVVHRDLKPENIFLTHPDGQLRAKVLDFGVAKLHDSLEHTGRKTAAGSIVGTPEYMAPEQLAGRPVDHRADIYALGICLYEALCGKRPFLGGFGELVVQHLTVEPAPLVAVPAPVARLVRQLLEKDPERRPQTMADVVAALDAVGAFTTRETVAVPRAPHRRGGALVAAAAVVGFVVVLAGAGAAAWLSDRSDRSDRSTPAAAVAPAPPPAVAPVVAPIVPVVDPAATAVPAAVATTASAPAVPAVAAATTAPAVTAVAVPVASQPKPALAKPVVKTTTPTTTTTPATATTTTTTTTPAPTTTTPAPTPKEPEPELAPSKRGVVDPFAEGG